MKNLISEHQQLTRQLDIIPLKCLDQEINIIGAGAIGSFIALSLAKMGFHNITVIDYDKIDIENLNCQFFRHTDIGQPKVYALRSLIKDFTDIEINIINDKWTGSKLNGIVITAVDSMSVRKQLFNVHHKKGYNTDLVVDPRMGSETAILASYRPLNIKEGVTYSKTLYSDSEAIQEPCTSKSVMYTVLGISSAVCAVVKAYITNKDFPRYKAYDMAKFDMV